MIYVVLNTGVLDTYDCSSWLLRKRFKFLVQELAKYYAAERQDDRDDAGGCSCINISRIWRKEGGNSQKFNVRGEENGCLYIRSICSNNEKLIERITHIYDILLPSA